MDKDNIFEDMKSTYDKRYRIKSAVSRVLKAAFTFIVCPAVLCASLAGGALTAADTLADESGASPFGLTFRQVSTSGKSAKLQLLQPCDEMIRETEEDILTRLYEFDRTQVPDGCYGIVPVSLYRQADPGTVYVSDAGDKKQIDAAEYIKKDLAVRYKNEYRVLIVHTHGTEAYSPEGALYCGKGDYPRSENKNENVVGIGDIFERVFIEAGIKTVHCEIPIDAESYSRSYQNAAKIIKDYLKKYPDIKYMFDIHRDAVELSDGSKARMVTAVDGQICAQLMFVVGSDRLVPENENWRDNLTLAVKLQTALDEKYPGLMRPINIKQGAFNQYFTPLSVLIEVGSDGNSLEEAKRSAEILAEQMVKTIKEG